MKLITAIVRPGKLEGLIETLIGYGAHGLTVTEVRGFGRQLGQIAPRPGERDRDGWRACLCRIPGIPPRIRRAAG